MKYYSLRLKLWNNLILDNKTKQPKVYPKANGGKIFNGNGYLTTTGNFGKIFFENYVDDAPVFDYFYLYNSSYQKEYDWILLDAYNYIGQNVPSARGFLVSKKFKGVLEKFIIAKPFRFYKSKLMYQGSKLEYYILHLAQNEWNEFDSKLSTLYIEGKKIEDIIASNRDFKNVLKKEDGKNLSMNIYLNDFSDLFYFSKLGYIVSERLKNKIIEEGLIDFEFIELNNFTFKVKNTII